MKSHVHKVAILKHLNIKKLLTTRRLIKNGSNIILYDESFVKKKMNIHKIDQQFLYFRIRVLKHLTSVSELSKEFLRIQTEDKDHNFASFVRLGGLTLLLNHLSSSTKSDSFQRLCVSLFLMIVLKIDYIISRECNSTKTIIDQPEFIALREITGQSKFNVTYILLTILLHTHDNTIHDMILTIFSYLVKLSPDIMFQILRKPSHHNFSQSEDIKISSHRSAREDEFSNPTTPTPLKKGISIRFSFESLDSSSLHDIDGQQQQLPKIATHNNNNNNNQRDHERMDSTLLSLYDQQSPHDATCLSYFLSISKLHPNRLTVITRCAEIIETIINKYPTTGNICVALAMIPIISLDAITRYFSTESNDGIGHAYGNNNYSGTTDGNIRTLKSYLDHEVAKVAKSKNKEELLLQQQLSKSSSYDNTLSTSLKSTALSNELYLKYHKKKKTENVQKWGGIIFLLQSIYRLCNNIENFRNDMESMSSKLNTPEYDSYIIHQNDSELSNLIYTCNQLLMTISLLIIKSNKIAIMASTTSIPLDIIHNTSNEKINILILLKRSSETCPLREEVYEKLKSAQLTLEQCIEKRQTVALNEVTKRLTLNGPLPGYARPKSSLSRREKFQKNNLFTSNINNMNNNNNINKDNSFMPSIHHSHSQNQLQQSSSKSNINNNNNSSSSIFNRSNLEQQSSPQHPLPSSLSSQQQQEQHEPVQIQQNNFFRPDSSQSVHSNNNNNNNNNNITNITTTTATSKKSINGNNNNDNNEIKQSSRPSTAEVNMPLLSKVECEEYKILLNNYKTNTNTNNTNTSSSSSGSRSSTHLSNPTKSIKLKTKKDISNKDNRDNSLYHNFDEQGNSKKEIIDFVIPKIKSSASSSSAYIEQIPFAEQLILEQDRIDFQHYKKSEKYFINKATKRNTLSTNLTIADKQKLFHVEKLRRVFEHIPDYMKKGYKEKLLRKIKSPTRSVST